MNARQSLGLFGMLGAITAGSTGMTGSIEPSRAPMPPARRKRHGRGTSPSAQQNRLERDARREGAMDDADSKRARKAFLRLRQRAASVPETLRVSP